MKIINSRKKRNVSKVTQRNHARTQGGKRNRKNDESETFAGWNRATSRAIACGKERRKRRV